MELKIAIRETEIVLHTSGALYFPDTKLLLISDVHLGKVMHFRKYGMAVPPEFLHSNFEKLSKVCDHFSAERIVFLGDLFHSKLNKEWFLFEDWVRSRKEKIILVSGNHDVIPRSFYENIGVDVVNELIEQPFLFVHEPEIREELFTFCGHIHPGIKLSGFGNQRLNLSCFFRSENQLILPAFGTFTGKFALSPEENDLAYAIAGEEIIAIPFNRN